MRNTPIPALLQHNSSATATVVLTTIATTIAATEQWQAHPSAQSRAARISLFGVAREPDG